MTDVNKRKCFCVESTEKILNLNGGDLVEITQDFGVFFLKSVPIFCVLLAECADWLVMQEILLLTEIDNGVMNRQLRYWS